MPPIVIDLRSADDTRDVVHRAVQALAEGKLVSLPTETVYGLAVSARDEEAVNRLLRAKGRGKNQVELFGGSRRSFRRRHLALEGSLRALQPESSELTTLNVSEAGSGYPNSTTGTLWPWLYVENPLAP